MFDPWVAVDRQATGVGRIESPAPAGALVPAGSPTSPAVAHGELALREPPALTPRVIPRKKGVPDDWTFYVRVIGAGLLAFHGYRRNDSPLWGAAWGFFGYFVPTIGLGMAFAQGFAKKAKQED